MVVQPCGGRCPLPTTVLGIPRGKFRLPAVIMALDFGAAHASWADMAEEEEQVCAPSHATPSVSGRQPMSAALAAELDLAAASSRDGLNLCFKSVGGGKTKTCNSRARGGQGRPCHVYSGGERTALPCHPLPFSLSTWHPRRFSTQSHALRASHAYTAVAFAGVGCRDSWVG